MFFKHTKIDIFTKYNNYFLCSLPFRSALTVTFFHKKRANAVALALFFKDSVLFLFPGFGHNLDDAILLYGDALDIVCI